MKTGIKNNCHSGLDPES